MYIKLIYMSGPAVVNNLKIHLLEEVPATLWAHLTAINALLSYHLISLYSFQHPKRRDVTLCPEVTCAAAERLGRVILLFAGTATRSICLRHQKQDVVSPLGHNRDDTSRRSMPSHHQLTSYLLQQPSLYSQLHVLR